MPDFEVPPSANASTSDDPHQITSEAALEVLYQTPVQNSISKEIDHLNQPYRAWVESSPFAILATSGPEGLDASPRGDEPGFVRIIDDRTLALPDRRGNNRLDSLRNVVRDPRVALLFMIPGCAETLRVNGQATITTEPELLASFAVKGKEPATVMLVKIDSVYFQCGRALLRSALWDPTKQPERSTIPSPGEMLKATVKDFDGDSYDKALPTRQRDTLY
ncbi:MAG: pyridoxamine 5'-phosphate oxidase family protein [Pseudomonadota bacterium]